MTHWSTGQNATSHISLRGTDTASSFASNTGVSLGLSSTSLTCNYPPESTIFCQALSELSSYFLFFFCLVLPPRGGNDNIDNGQKMAFVCSVTTRHCSGRFPCLIGFNFHGNYFPYFIDNKSKNSMVRKWAQDHARDSNTSLFDATIHISLSTWYLFTPH